MYSHANPIWTNGIFYFFSWFLFHNIGISPLEIGIGTALLGDGELELDM
jgi:hypothetical protein